MDWHCIKSYECGSFFSVVAVHIRAEKYSPITSITFPYFAGTGSSGATVRMYVDSYENDESKIGRSSAEMLSTCVDVALQVFYRR